MSLIELIIELDGLIYRRNDYRVTKEKFGDGFEDTLAGEMLEAIEIDIDKRTEELIKILKTEPIVLNQISAWVNN